MTEVAATTPSLKRLLAIIELQNVIAATAMNADDVMRVAAERASALTGATGGMVALLEGEDITCKAVSGATEAALGLRLPRAWSLAGRCIEERKAMRSDNAPADPRVDPETRTRTGAGSILCVPLLYGEHAVGVLEVVSAKLAAFTDEDAATLPLLAEIIAIALHRAYTYPRPRLDSMHDAVSGLANRRAYEDRLQAELGRNRRYGHSFSLAAVRLVGLETASDRMGQAAADQILRDVAKIVEANSRVIDACFRLAGDELAVVMPGTSLEGARVLADRFRTQIADAKLGQPLVTPTFAVVEAADESVDQLTGRVTEALARQGR